MPERSQDLESFRDKFMQSLREAQPQHAGHQDFVRYWRTVEKEASETDDLSKLEGWVRDISRDKNEVRAMKERLETMDERDPMSEQLLQVMRMLLEFLEGIEKRVRRLRDERRAYLQALLWKGGPGMKPKDDKSDDKKDEKKDGAVPALLLQQDKQQVKQAPEMKAQEKKMQR
ncbi:MAG: hypothetical protein IT385_05365 [Deltaproteobacteria bacterium]|nr:hypothetical protein [Deltaproteobacteria bacterium]